MRVKAEPAGNIPPQQGSRAGLWLVKADLEGLIPGAFSVVSYGWIHSINV